MIQFSNSSVINMFSEAMNATAGALGGRTGKSNFDGIGQYGMWNPNQAAGKFDVLSLIPTLLIVGIGIMLLPVIISCFSQIIAPLNYSNGRKKREAGDKPLGLEDLLPTSTTGVIFDLLATFSKAMTKFNSL